MTNKNNSNVIIYQGKSGAIELAVDVKAETLLLTQMQIAEIFDVKKATISKHVKNIFTSNELDKKSTVSKMETVQKEGKRNIVRKIEYYNLDLVLSIGYRVNSIKATKFRQWATKILKKHIAYGYTINRSRIALNYDKFIETVDEVRSLLPLGMKIDSNDALELIKLFADTWLSLDAYDKDKLPVTGSTKKTATLTAGQLTAVLISLKKEINGENFFGIERESGSIATILGNVLQSFAGKDLYPTIEEKAAHLLYFVVKNHPFIDGNKRCGAYSFIWFLKKFGNLNLNKTNPAALTALTILVAESNPKDKERIIKLILQILA